MTTTDIKNIPIDDIVEPWILLRLVNEAGLEYAELFASIQDHGLLSSIAVRKSERQPEKYEVIDGMWRLHVCRKLHWISMPCIIKEATDNDVLALQLSANAIRPQTTPGDFAKQLRRIQKYHLDKTGDDMTMQQLASMVNKGIGWVSKMLEIGNLPKDMQMMVNRGEISITNGYYLAKIPRQFRRQYLDDAKTMKGSDFKAMSLAVIKQFREAIKQGKVDAFWTLDFTPQPYLRSLTTILNEYESHEAMVKILSKTQHDPQSVWLAALEWAMNLDEDSVREQEEAARKRDRTQFEASRIEGDE